MVIKIDLNLLPERFKSVIIHDINREYRHHHNLKTHKNVGYHVKYISPKIDNNHNIITLDSDDKSDLRRVERMVKDILIKRRIHDYVVMQDEKEEEDKIVILKREHGEQRGIYHCRHCGMAFEDVIQLSAHLRIHYLI